MKWLSSKYAYPLIALSLIVSVGLQAVWLKQLFGAQKQQLEQEIEHTVSNVAKNNIYNVLIKTGEKENAGMKGFFLSDQWQQIRIAFDNILGIKGVHGMSTTFSFTTNKDSMNLDMRLSLNPKTEKRKSGAYYSNSPEERKKTDLMSLGEMNKHIGPALSRIGVTLTPYYAQFSYVGKNEIKNTFPKGEKPGYTSQKYSYDLEHTRRYQLLLPSIDGIVWYRMRYYLASSVLMVLLTASAFYFILRLLRKQHMYAMAKVAFTSNMTHEFKTPIATVTVALESIMRYQLASEPEKMQNYLNISLQELQRLNLMVEKALSLGQEDLTDHQLHLELYDVQAGLEQVIIAMELQLQDSAAHIRFQPNREPCFIFGDPVHLSSVFYNLIDNAIKYGGKDLVLQISCEINEKELTITFSDNGPGIDKIYQDRIFDRFFRVPARGDVHNVKGFGVGLYFVKDIIQKHKGTIQVKSEPGKGTSFIINLPQPDEL